MAQASVIQSMTIEEIGVASGGMGSSQITNGGGRFSFNAPQSVSAMAFVSAGSTDEALFMNMVQGDLAFTPGFVFSVNIQVLPNTLNGAPTGAISGNAMTLDLSGWGANVSQGLGYFPMHPDLDSLLTYVAMIDPKSFFYTADWVHTITLEESADFAGQKAFWHLEGIATVPEPSTLWLLGTVAVGLMFTRRRKST
ncbi:MAG: PEP-CTERM sorting domain-containing protein [Thiobacillus sp.]